MIGSNPNPENPEQSGYNCAACHRPDNDETNMVFCDHCQRWYHFGCAGVNDDVRNISWSCPDCEACESDVADSSELQKELEQLEEEKKKQKRQIEREMILHRKRLQMQQELLDMRQQLEREKRNMELEFEKAQLEKKIAEEEEHQKNLNEMRANMNEKLKLLKLKRTVESDVGELQSNKESAVGRVEKEGSKEKSQNRTIAEKAKAGKIELENKKSRKGKPETADPILTSCSDIRGAYRKHSTPKVTDRVINKQDGIPYNLPESFPLNRDNDVTPFGHPEIPKKKENNSGGKMKIVPEVTESESENSSTDKNDISDEDSYSDTESYVEDENSSVDEEDRFEKEDGSEMEKESSGKSENDEVPARRKKETQLRKHRSQYDPTKAQLSARQFLSKKLPVFSGKLEEWPMFISSYETSTKACGFSDLENLARLQECLKGEALEAVRSRLLLPKAVPKIIETLRMLFGRPEKLLNMLLVKVRSTASPKADRLSSFISFGIIVQQLADHLEATDLTAHLVNPMLIQELTDKLPAATQLQWVRYRRKSKVVTLRTLSNFLSNIVKDASEVASYGDAARYIEQGFRKGKKEKYDGFVHTHSVEQSSVVKARGESSTTKERKPCRICGRVDHRIRNCEMFRRLQLADRWDAVQKWQLCQVCLNEHGNAECKLNIRCNVESCRERHNSLLHSTVPIIRSNCNVHAIQRKPSIVFRMMPVTLYCGSCSVNTIAFFDEGSSYTLIERSLKDVLGARGVIQPLRVTWTAGVSRLEKGSQKIDLCISAKGSRQRYPLKGVHTVENLKLPQHSLDVPQLIQQYTHLQGIPVAKFQQSTPQILIGLKDIHLYAPIESRIGQPEEPIAVRSKLGWTVYGPTSEAHFDTGLVGHHSCNTVSNQELHDLLKSHYDMEETGISVALLPEPEEDRRALEILKATTVGIVDRFEIGLLWKDDDPSFPDSYPMALKRLQSLEKRLIKDPELYEKVRGMIAEYLAKRYAHKATLSELAAFESRKIP
ncbi:uncharacterized protein LOC131425723 [Malaya genurostris]|uniref:uncharacterized protein LOC131425723 n=1 Tax=Malaya genurostris TaxID=325434 RepID=UPI0026F3FD21|nr:uncharacterized protein LOC131425723 [Malaya genurostris]